MKILISFISLMMCSYVNAATLPARARELQAGCSARTAGNATRTRMRGSVATCAALDAEAGDGHRHAGRCSNVLATPTHTHARTD